MAFSLTPGKRFAGLDGEITGTNGGMENDNFFAFPYAK